MHNCIDASKQIIFKEFACLVGKGSGLPACLPCRTKACFAPLSAGKAARSNVDVLRLKITLLGMQPAIWRQIEIPADYNFWELHVAIQDSMGWTDSHLHAFRVIDPKSGEEFSLGIPDEEELGDLIKPGWEYPIVMVFRKPGDHVEYEYDFGDTWLHEIVLEISHAAEAGTRYPRCISGERACPPEDCGGTGGYKDLLQTLKKPGSEKFKEITEWLGRPLDPEAFDPKEVAFDDPRKRWDQAFGSDLF